MFVYLMSMWPSTIPRASATASCPCTREGRVAAAGDWSYFCHRYRDAEQTDCTLLLPATGRGRDRCRELRRTRGSLKLQGNAFSPPRARIAMNSTAARGIVAISVYRKASIPVLCRLHIGPCTRRFVGEAAPYQAGGRQVSDITLIDVSAVR